MSNKKAPSDIPFYAAMWAAGGMYFVLIIALLYADASYTSVESIGKALCSLAFSLRSFIIASIDFNTDSSLASRSIREYAKLFISSEVQAK